MAHGMIAKTSSHRHCLLRLFVSDAGSHSFSRVRHECWTAGSRFNRILGWASNL